MNRTRVIAAVTLATVAVAIVVVALVSCTPSTRPRGNAAVDPVSPSTSSPIAVSPPLTTPTTPAITAIGPSGNAMGADDLQNLEDAVSSGNTAALEGYCAPTVHVVTTEGVDQSVPASGIDQAVTDGVEDPALTTTWTWSPDAATQAAYRAGPYGSSFPTDAVVGTSSTGSVIAYTVVGHQVSAVLMSRHENRLR